MTDYQDQQTCKDNTIHSQAIPPGSVRQTQTDAVEGILKQFENQTQQNKTCTYNELLNNVWTGNSTSDTQQESTQHKTINNYEPKKDNSEQRTKRQCK